MAVGLQVYNADGSLDLDLTKRIPKFIGSKDCTGTGQLLISEVADNQTISFGIHLKLYSQRR